MEILIAKQIDKAPGKGESLKKIHAFLITSENRNELKFIWKNDVSKAEIEWFFVQESFN